MGITIEIFDRPAFNVTSELFDGVDCGRYQETAND